MYYTIISCKNSCDSVLYSDEITATVLNVPINGGGRHTIATIKRWSMREVCVVIRFLHAKGDPYAGICEKKKHLHFL